MLDKEHIDISLFNGPEDVEKLENTINKIAKQINIESTYQISIDPETGKIETRGTLFNKDIITTIKQLEKIYLSSSKNVDLHDLYYFLITELHSISNIKSVMIETLLTPLFVDKNNLDKAREELHIDLSKFVMRYKELASGKTSSKQIDFSEYVKIPLRGSDKLYSDILTLIFEPNQKMILSLLTSSQKDNIESAFDKLFDI